MEIRYIRNYLNGNSLDNYNRWVEIKAFDIYGNNVALGKTVSANFTPSSSYKPLSALVDNDVNTANFISSGVSNKQEYVQIDLGDLYFIEKIIMWHYYGDSRIYHGNVLQVSTNGTNWITVFDSSVDGEYVETASGFIVDIGGKLAKFYNLSGTYISQSNPDTNYSTDTVYLLGNGNQVLLKTDFDKSLGYIKSARLIFNVTNMAAAGDINVVRLNSNWSVDSVTYNTAPLFDSNIFAFNVNNTGTQIIDLTKLLKQIYDADNYGIALFSPTAQLTLDKNVQLLIDYVPTEIILPNEIRSNGILVKWKPIKLPYNNQYFYKQILKRSTTTNFAEGTVDIIFETIDRSILQYLDTAAKPNTNYYYKILVQTEAVDGFSKIMQEGFFELSGIKKTPYGYTLDGGVIYFTQ